MDFIQVIKSEISGKLRKSKGQIDYKYPGQIRFKVEDKVSSLFVSNRKTQWYYTPPFIEGEQGEVKISKNNKNILTDLFDIIKKYGEKKNKHYEVTNSSEKQSLITFLPEAQQKLGAKSLELSFIKKTRQFNDINKFVIQYNDERKVTFEVVSLELNKKFKVSHFSFDIPPNTKIVR
ncbi:MAG: LolA family protein [Bacteriovoracaceae bacterium]